MIRREPAHLPAFPEMAVWDARADDPEEERVAVIDVLEQRDDSGDEPARDRKAVR